MRERSGRQGVPERSVPNGWRVVLAQRTPPLRAAAKRSRVGKRASGRGRDAEFTKRARNGSQRSAAIASGCGTAAWRESRLAITLPHFRLYLLTARGCTLRSYAAGVVLITCLITGPTTLFAAPFGGAGEAGRVDEVFASLNRPDSPGCAVAVTKDGRVLYERGYGMADLGHEVKITPSTIFSVGSIAKQFTAAAILLLAQEGKLSLDDPVRKYVPELPDFGAPVTLRQMLHLTSGLRDYEQLLWFDGWRLDSPDLLTDGDILRIMSRQKELNFPPGSQFSYSNTNYMLLAQVVNRVSKQPFPDFTMTRLFEPLGMQRSHFRDDHGESVKNLAFPYEPKDGAFDLSIPNYDTVGATNLLTTVEDLARWDENLYTAKVGGRQLVTQLQEPGQLNDGTPLDYSEGMFVGAPGGMRMAESGSAGDAGYIANISRFPDQHFFVATLCNLASVDPLDLSHRVADIYLGGKLSAALSAAAGPHGSVQIDPKQSAAYVGTFVDREKNFILKIEQRGDALWGQWFMGPSSLDSQLEVLSQKRLGFPGLGEIDFAADGNLSMTAKVSGPRPVSYVRLPDYKPVRAELNEFAGKYSSNELDIPYYVTLDRDNLVLHPPKMPQRRLVALINDLFVCDGIQVHFTRDPNGHVIGFLMNGRWNRVQNLRFARAMQP